jgi:Holliday junction resolvase RusA-like endonuclease
VTRWGTYYSKTYKQWLSVAEELLAVNTGTSLDFPLTVHVLLAIPRSKTSQLIVPVGDGDNYEKALYDMLQKQGWIADDKWITTGHWKKRFIPHGHEGFTRVEIWPEEEEIDIEP